ncbi:MAG: pantetheine-phosphate adenylyltransferase [Arachnia sp.]
MTVLCPGSFDPITLGHLDVLERARDVFGDVVVAVGTNSSKRYLFGEQRLQLARQATAHLDGVSVEPMDGLLIDYCRERGITTVVKGLRSGTDLDFELQMAHPNRALGGIETVFLPASAAYLTLSSTILRVLISGGADPGAYVPAPVLDEVRRRRQRGDFGGLGAVQ